MKAIILRDFVEDGRVSMEHYADQLVKGLHGFIGSENVSEFKPEIPGWLKGFPFLEMMKMRVARFLLYPQMLNKMDADIFHIIDHGYAHLMRSIDPAKTVVTVHDLIPFLAHKGLIKGLHFPVRPLLVEYSLSYLKMAGKIVTVSENTKKDLVKHLGCDSSKIEIVCNGLDERFRLFGLERRRFFRKNFGLPDVDCYLILVSGVQAYKNHETSLKVLRKLLAICGKPVYMVRLGESSNAWDKLVKDNLLEKQVFSTGSLPTDRVVELYNCVDCLLFPSWYEGFGWPPLEAMACGTPVVSSNAASLPEVVGDAGLMEDPGDVEALTQAVYNILTKDELRKNLIKKGIERAQQFSWQKAAKNIIKVYHMAVNMEF